MININTKNLFNVDNNILSCFAYNINKNYFPITKNTLSGVSGVLSHLNFNSFPTVNNTYRYILDNYKDFYIYLKKQNDFNISSFLKKVRISQQNTSVNFSLDLNDRKFFDKCFFDKNKFVKFVKNENKIEKDRIKDF